MRKRDVLSGVCPAFLGSSDRGNYTSEIVKTNRQLFQIKRRFIEIKCRFVFQSSR